MPTTYHLFYYCGISALQQLPTSNNIAHTYQNKMNVLLALAIRKSKYPPPSLYLKGTCPKHSPPVNKLSEVDDIFGHHASNSSLVAIRHSLCIGRTYSSLFESRTVTLRTNPSALGWVFVTTALLQTDRGAVCLFRPGSKMITKSPTWRLSLVWNHWLLSTSCGGMFLSHVVQNDEILF